MSGEPVIMPIAPGSKKRTIMPNELFGKFSAKSDFIKYFREILQLYLPPEYMMYASSMLFEFVCIGTKTFSRKYSLESSCSCRLTWLSE